MLVFLLLLLSSNTAASIATITSATSTITTSTTMITTTTTTTTVNDNATTNATLTSIFTATVTYDLFYLMASSPQLIGTWQRLTLLQRGWNLDVYRYSSRNILLFVIVILYTNVLVLGSKL